MAAWIHLKLLCASAEGFVQVSPLTAHSSLGMGWEEEQKHAGAMETHTTPGPWQRAGFLYKQGELTTEVVLDHTVLAMTTRGVLKQSVSKKNPPCFHCSCCKKAFKHIFHRYK